MSFLKKLFGPKDPVETLRLLHARQDWAAFLAALKRLDRDGLDPAARAEIDAMQVVAGDNLARLNLDEGAWAERCGEMLKARDHYSLALEQACSTELKAHIEQTIAGMGQSAGRPDMTAASDNRSDCGPGCGPQPLAAAAPVTGGLDDEGRMELLLATLPPDLAERYQAADPSLRQAWLAVQDGNDAQAEQLLEQVPAAARGPLFLAERGALLARRGALPDALRDLRAALEQDPDLFPAFDALVAVLTRSGQEDAVVKLLKQALAENRFTAYCWARLAELHARNGAWPAALAAGLEALERGEQDPGLLILCSQLLEREERYEAAEQLLQRLPAGGCGGGAHPMLAEYWLRRGKQLDRALESFKSALRQERDNPRWPLRIAQVYLAKGWTRDAASQLELLLGRGDLPEDLQAEVTATAAKLSS